MALAMSGCAVIDATTATVKGATTLVTTTGKLVVETAKVTGKVVKTTGDVVVKTGQAAKKIKQTASDTAELIGPERVVHLEKEGNSLYANVKINGRTKARLLLDTGATSVQISSRIARRLGIPLRDEDMVPVGLAGGRQAIAYSVILKELRLGPMRVKNVRALVFENDLSDDDGLLGMSFLNNFSFKIDAQRGRITLKRL